jgi:hypothetical protein
MHDAEVNLSDLTILSVNFKGKFYFDLNFTCAAALNKTDALKWIVAENTPEGADGKIDFSDKRFQVIPGIDSKTIPQEPRGSYHHGTALNKGKEFLKTRFALVLDPDFFIVKQNWITEVLSYMVKNDLSFFGVPWHPRHWQKYRYFPCVHCVFIDLSKVALDSLDFRPDLINNPSRQFKPRFWIEYQRLQSQKRWLRRCYWLLRQPWLSIEEDSEQRHYIGSSRDTGYFLYQKFSRDDRYKSGTITPVFHPGQDIFIPAGVSRLQSSKMIECLKTDRNSYIPKRRGYFTGKGFRENGFVDVNGLGWEEFVWQDEPFGFHMRGFLQAQQDTKTRNNSVVRALQNLTGLTLPAQDGD